MMKIAFSDAKRLAANLRASFPPLTLSEMEAEFREVDAKLVEFLKQSRLKAPGKEMRRGQQSLRHSAKTGGPASSPMQAPKPESLPHLNG
jgi:hypothetical protein